MHTHECHYRAFLFNCYQFQFCKLKMISEDMLSFYTEMILVAKAPTFVSSNISKQRWSNFTMQGDMTTARSDEGGRVWVGKTAFMTWKMEVKTGLWPNSWKDWWLYHATNAFYQLIKRVGGVGAGEKCFLHHPRHRKSTHRLNWQYLHTCTHTHMQVTRHPAAVALIPRVSSSAALSHPSTLSLCTSR